MLFDLSPVLIVLFILVVYLLMSINILAEYERGRRVPARQAAAAAERARRDSRVRAASTAWFA